MEPKTNNQVIIFKNDDDDGKRHFTWSDYCHFTYVFKYWILGVSLILAIIGYLVLSLWWNPKNSISTAHVEVDMPLSIQKDVNGHTTSIEYLDGSRYTMYEIVSPENIRDVIDNTKDENGNLIFGSVNYEGLIESNGLSIALETETVYEGSNSYQSALDRGNLQYVITCKGEYVGDSNLVGSFVNALIQNVIDKAVSLIPNQYLDSLIPDYYQSLDLDVLLSRISNQYNTIDSLYQNLLNQFQETDQVAISTSASSTTTQTTNLRNAYYKIFQEQYLASSGDSTVFQYLESLLSLNHYIRYTVGEEEVAIQNCMDDGDILIDRLEDTTRMIRLLTESLARYDAIIATGNISNAVQEQYNNISQRLETSRSTEESILKDLSDLGYQFTRDPDSEYDYVVTLPDYTEIDESDYGTIQHLQNPNDDAWKASCSAFIQQVDALVPQINFSLTQANQVYRSLYTSEETGVTYRDVSKVVTEGGLSAFLGAAAGLVLGFALSSIILSAYGYIEEKQGIPVSVSADVSPVETKPNEESKAEEAKDNVTEETKEEAKKEEVPVEEKKEETSPEEKDSDSSEEKVEEESKAE